jgi:small subunit ribosomal protein S7
MGRKNKTINRPVTPDPKYNSAVVSKFVTRMMFDGKKATCLRLVYDAFDKIKAKAADKDPLEVFLKALDNVKPMFEVKSRRVGGATYQVPIEIRESRREALAMRWIIAASRAKNGHGMGDCLASELFDAFNNPGVAYKKKEDTHRMAEANQAFAHYRW